MGCFQFPQGLHSLEG